MVLPSQVVSISANTALLKEDPGPDSGRALVIPTVDLISGSSAKHSCGRRHTLFYDTK